MHVNDLPDDVLILVIHAVLPAIKRQLADVRCGLGLLSVCRRWREVALPMVYDTVVVKCGTEDTDGPETVDIETTLDLVVDAKCLHMVRRVVIEVCYRTNSLQGLKAVIDRMRGAASKWAGVRKLELGLNAWGSGVSERNTPAAKHKNDIASVSSALSALMPGLRKIKFDDSPQTPIAKVLFGKLAGFYADQLQVLHSSSSLVVPQDRVFARLRDVKIIGYHSESLEGKLPRIDPEVVESLVLEGLLVDDMWSMFCADSDGCAIIFPRLTNLDLEYRPRSMVDSERLADEHPWALQFPAVKHVRVVCFDEECPSMQNAVFPNLLESLDIFGCLESDCYNLRKLVIGGMDLIPPELITYTGLTHLYFNVLMKADDVMQIIRRQRHLVDLHVNELNLDDTQTEFPIPECAKHEPVAPLDTRLRELSIGSSYIPTTADLAFQMLKYLLLRIPTLKSVTTIIVPVEQIQTFIDKYVQWYPHMANVKLME